MPYQLLNLIRSPPHGEIAPLLPNSQQTYNFFSTLKKIALAIAVVVFAAGVIGLLVCPTNAYEGEPCKEDVLLSLKVMAGVGGGLVGLFLLYLCASHSTDSRSRSMSSGDVFDVDY